ncbi:MAG: SPOR domain-containing protein [Acidobacteriaceae bacterium]|nr:SPOR domain-containing protein [Acidobacteriaceae bacterium]
MSPTEFTISTPDWKSLQGTTLEGGYELKEILEAEENAASFRVRVLGDYSQRAFASFYRAAAEELHQQVVIWDTLRQVTSANLSVPLGAGAISVGDVPVEYAVLPVPDETLGGVLRERPLTEEEAREMMFSVVGALEILHANGFAHGRVSPEEVLAVGDSIQLSTAGVRRLNSLPLVSTGAGKYLAPESVVQNVTAGADVWCLGATLFEALRGKPYTASLDLEAEGLPPAFARVAAGCLQNDPQTRCTLGQIRELYEGKALPPPVPIAVVETSAASMGEPAIEQADLPQPEVNGLSKQTVQPESEASSADAAADPGPVVASAILPDEADAQPNLAQTTILPPAASAPETPILISRPARGSLTSDVAAVDDRERPRRLWLYSGIAVLALLAIVLIARGRHEVKPNTVPAAKAQSEWPTRTLTPDTQPAKTTAQPASASTPTGTRKEAAPAKTSRANPNEDVWRVVLYTYGRQQDAEKKAQALNQKHPGLGVEVFAPKGTSPYLVVAGGKMTREEAIRMRKTALRMGMPRDAYIQNYNQ